MKRGYVDIQEGQVHYVTSGAGAPLFLLHQGPRSSREYWKLQTLLSSHFRCIAPDTLGFGNSDPAPDGIRFEDLARSVVDTMDALGIPKAHVFGWHTGNKIGTALAANWPDRVVRLILCGMTHSLVADRAMRNKGIKTVVSRFKRFDHSLSENELLLEWASAFSSIAAIWWDSRTLSHRNAGMDRFRQIEYQLLDFLQARVSMHDSVRANIDYDLIADMRRLKAPTLVIELCSAGEDKEFGRQGSELMAVIPHGELATLENGGLDSMASDAQRLAPIIVSYLTD